jgi:hypothetical protein
MNPVVALERAMKLLETIWNEARKAISPHILESTEGLSHRSSYVHHENLWGHNFRSFVTGLFCNNRVNLDNPIEKLARKQGSRAVEESSRVSPLDSNATLLLHA